MFGLGWIATVAAATLAGIVILSVHDLLRRRQTQRYEAAEKAAKREHENRERQNELAEKIIEARYANTDDADGEAEDGDDDGGRATLETEVVPHHGGDWPPMHPADREATTEALDRMYDAVMDAEDAIERNRR